jgi:predicted lipoprotein with Yx(FWY)xxD motif
MKPLARTTCLAGAAICGLAIAAVGAPSLGAATPTVKAAHNSALNRTIVVTSTGRTLYRRSGETSQRILCGKVCKGVWPPLTVPSGTTPLVKGAGVTGALGKVHLPDGRWQVTLRGYPVYRFAGDHHAGETKGQGVAGIWSVVPASTAGTAPRY